jgi:hypothetical protein
MGNQREVKLKGSDAEALDFLVIPLPPFPLPLLVKSEIRGTMLKKEYY